MNELKNRYSRQAAIEGMQIKTVDRLTHQEFHLTLQPLPGEKPDEIVRRLALAIQEREAGVVRHEIFGSIAADPETVSALKREFSCLDWPVMWVEGQTSADQGISGMHVFAVAGTQVDTLDLDGQPIGRIYSDGYARHCLLGDIKPLNLRSSKADQCRQTFEQLERALGGAGMSMINVARTWFFLEDILGWYGPFNRIRNEFYREKNMFHGLMPASTGIGGKNPLGSAIIAGAWAVQKTSDDVVIGEVPSPLQQSSLEYGSAFSRAVIMTAPDSKRLLISGTASIEANGQSVHHGNVREQIALSMEVVRQILSAKGFGFPDVTRTTAYFKDMRDFLSFEEWRTMQNLDFPPVLATQGDICRGELLFEIELDAVKT